MRYHFLSLTHLFTHFNYMNFYVDLSNKEIERRKDFFFYREFLIGSKRWRIQKKKKSGMEEKKRVKFNIFTSSTPFDHYQNLWSKPLMMDVPSMPNFSFRLLPLFFLKKIGDRSFFGVIAILVACI